MKYLLLTLVLLLIGCGENVTVRTITPDSNLTIPIDDSIALQPSEGIIVTVSDDGANYIISGDGNIIIIGDNNTYGDNNGDSTTTTETTTETTTTIDLWYYTSTSSCCYSCGECDTNTTDAEILTTGYLPGCDPDFSGGYCAEISGG